MSVQLAILAALSILALTVGLFLRERYRTGSQAERAERVRMRVRDPHEVRPAASLLQEKGYSAIPQLNTILTGMQVTQQLERLVRHAGVRLRVGDVVMRTVLLGMVLAAIVFVLKDSVPMAVLAFAGGPLLTLVWLRRSRKKRRATIMTQLPDALDMIRSSLQAGHSLNHALELVGEEAPDPLSGEIRQALDLLRLGHPLREALDGIYQRTGIEDLRFFTIAVLLNRELGGSLTDIVEVVANTIRERFKLKGQIRALTAQGRISALVLTLLSPTLLVILTLLNSEYLQPLYGTPIGRFALAYCGVSILFGYFLMRQITDVKVIRTD